MTTSELGLEFIFFGILIFLTLLAAIGAWRRPKTLSREDAEELFAQAHERNCGETQRVFEMVQESNRTNRDELTKLKAELTTTSDLVQERLNAALAELQTSVTQAADQQQESIQRNLGDLTNNVSAALSEARRSQDAGIEKVETSLQQVRQEVDRASNEVRTSIVDLARQHNEAKAQSAVQLCEALISSLGTLRNTIAAQIADNRTADLLPGSGDRGILSGHAGPGPEQAPDGPDDPAQDAPDREVHPS